MTHTPIPGQILHSLLRSQASVNETSKSKMLPKTSCRTSTHLPNFSSAIHPTASPCTAPSQSTPKGPVIRGPFTTDEFSPPISSPLKFWVFEMEAIPTEVFPLKYHSSLIQGIQITTWTVAPEDKSCLVYKGMEPT